MTGYRRRRQGAGRRRLAIMLVAGAVGVVLVPRSATAQAGATSGDGPSRAALLETARQGRVPAVVPPTKSAIEGGDTDAGQEVPFYYLPTLGGAEQLRGIPRVPIPGQPGTPRDDPGVLRRMPVTVAARRGDLRLREMDVAYGVGFRIHSNNAFLARLDLAFSREGFIPL